MENEKIKTNGSIIHKKTIKTSKEEKLATRIVRKSHEYLKPKTDRWDYQHFWEDVMGILKEEENGKCKDIMRIYDKNGNPLGFYDFLEFWIQTYDLPDKFIPERVKKINSIGKKILEEYKEE